MSQQRATAGDLHLRAMSDHMEFVVRAEMVGRELLSVSPFVTDAPLDHQPRIAQILDLVG